MSDDAQTPERRAAALLAEIDEIARAVSPREYGLPIYSDEEASSRGRLLAAVLGAIVAAEARGRAAERARIERIVHDEIFDADLDSAPCCKGNAADILARIRAPEDAANDG